MSVADRALAGRGRPNRTASACVHEPSISAHSHDAFSAGSVLPPLGARHPGVTAAILVDDALARAYLRAALRNRAVVLICHRIDELLPLLCARRIDVVIVAPWDSRGERTAPELREIRARLPSIPVAVYSKLTADAMRELVALVKAGADDVIFEGIDDESQALWSRLFISVCRRAAEQALAALHPLLPAHVEPIVSYCLERAQHAVTVDQVASALQIHRRTLAHRMALAGMPAPSTMISWCRLFVAARLLEDPGRRVEQVALTLGFGSGAALRNMLRRYTGLRPTELRSEGGLGCVVQQFAKTISSPKLRLA